MMQISVIVHLQQDIQLQVCVCVCQCQTLSGGFQHSPFKHYHNCILDYANCHRSPQVGFSLLCSNVPIAVSLQCYQTTQIVLGISDTLLADHTHHSDYASTVDFKVNGLLKELFHIQSRCSLCLHCERCITQFSIHLCTKSNGTSSYCYYEAQAVSENQQIFGNWFMEHLKQCYTQNSERLF